MSSVGTWTIEIGGSSFAAVTDVVNPLTADGGPNILTVEGYQAAGALFYNLGNNKSGWAFDVTKNFATDTLATNFYMEGIQTWAGAANVVVTHIDYSGTTTTWNINTAKVELKINQPIGPSCNCRLTITGPTTS
jgi:hypothetical protein